MLTKLKVLPLLLFMMSGHSMAQINLGHSELPSDSNLEAIEKYKKSTSYIEATDYVNNVLAKQLASNELSENIKKRIEQENNKNTEIISNLKASPSLSSVQYVDLEIQEYIIQNPSKDFKEFDDSIKKAKNSKEIENLLNSIGNVSEHTIYNFDKVSLERRVIFKNEQNYKSINQASNNNKYGKIFSAYNFNILIYEQPTDYFVMLDGNTNNSYVEDDFKGQIKNDDRNGSGFNNFKHSLSVIGGQYMVMSAVQSKIQSNINEMRLILIKVN